MNLSSPGKDIHANKYADHFSEWFCKCNSRNISDIEKERHFSRDYIKFTRYTAIRITGIALFILFSHWPSLEFHPFPSLEFSPFPSFEWSISFTLCCSLFVRLYDRTAVNFFIYQLFGNSSFIQTGRSCCSQWVIRVVSFKSCSITQFFNTF